MALRTHSAGRRQISAQRMATEKTRPRALLLFAAFSMLLMSGCAGLFGLGAFLEIGRLSRVAGWPAVEGTIVASSALAACQGPAAFTPRIEYTYEYGGVLRHGTRRDMGAPVCDTEAAATVLAHRYPVGSRVAVHVDPARPEQAVLDTAVSTGPLWFMGLVAAFVGVASLAWLLPRLRVLLRGRGAPAR